MNKQELISELNSRMAFYVDMLIGDIGDPEDALNILDAKSQVFSLLRMPLLTYNERLDIIKQNLESLKREHGIEAQNEFMDFINRIEEQNRNGRGRNKGAAESGKKNRNPKSKRSCKKRQMKWIKKSLLKKGHCRKSKNLK